MEQAVTRSLTEKNRRVGLSLTLIVTGLLLYSFWVIKSRGRALEPENLTKAQKIFRGL